MIHSMKFKEHCSCVQTTLRLGLLVALGPLVQCNAVIKALEETALDNATIEASISTLGEELSGAEASEGNTQGQQSTRLDPSALTLGGGCLEITTEPSVLSQLQLPTNFTITWTYNNCRRIGIGTRSGTRTVQVNRDPNTQLRTMEETRQFTTVNRQGASVDSNSTLTIVSLGTIAEGEINRTLVASGERKRTEGDGKLNYHFKHDLDLTSVKDTFNNGELSLRVVSGTGTIRHENKDREIEMTATNLTYYPQLCCYPQAGQIDYKIRQADGSTKVELRKFTSDCGEVEDRDGNKRSLIDCPSNE